MSAERNKSGEVRSAAGGLELASASGASASETDNVSALELQSNKRMLYFSDGVMEELSSGSEDEADAEMGDKCYDVHLNEVHTFSKDYGWSNALPAIHLVHGHVAALLVYLF